LPVGNYRGTFSFSCTAPAAVTCNVSSVSMDPATGAGVVAVTATASRAAGANVVAAILLPGFLLTGMGWRRRRRWLSGLAVLTVAVLGLAAGVSGCGGGSSKMNPGPTAQAFSVTATSGSVSHTTTLTLNVQ